MSVTDTTRVEVYARGRALHDYRVNRRYRDPYTASVDLRGSSALYLAQCVSAGDPDIDYALAQFRAAADIHAAVIDRAAVGRHGWDAMSRTERFWQTGRITTPAATR